MKKKFIFISLLLSLSYSYSQSVKDLELQLKSLQDEYVNFKSQSILKRDKIDKEVKLVDDQITQLYNSKNIVQQEYFVSKDNKESLDARVDEVKENKQSFNGRIIELIDREKKKTKSLLPYLIESSILKLKQQDELYKKNPSLSSYSYLDYRSFIIKESEKKTIRETEILNPRNELIKVKELRIGFIHDSYISNDGKEVGFLINKMTFSGPLFSWKDASGDLKSQLSQQIFKIYNSNELKPYNIPIDVGDAGEKLPYFLNSDGTGKSNAFTSFMDFFNKGGVMMYPLFFSLIIAFLILIERFSFFRKNRIHINNSVLKKIIDTASKGDKTQAKKMCEVENNVLTRILSQMLDAKSRDSAERIAEETMMEEIPKLEKRISTLGMLAGIAPLMGLLGTVVGMIALFNVITTYGSNNPKILAGGISIALVTTQTGLAIAIPILVFQHILNRIKNSIVIRIDVMVTRSLNRIYSS